MTIRVHNLRYEPMPAGDPHHVYIGRRTRTYAASPLGNPYRLTSEAARAECVAQYRGWLLQNSMTGAVAAELSRLRDLAMTGPLHLYCWCAPRLCHGGVIALLLEEMMR